MIKVSEKLSFNKYQEDAFELISKEGKKDLLTNGVLGLEEKVMSAVILLRSINIKDMN